MERRRVPFSGAVFSWYQAACFATNGFYLPNPVGVKVLQALGLPAALPRLMWNIRPTGMLSFPFGKRAVSRRNGCLRKAVALDVKGQEHWQRELPKVQVGPGPQLAVADFAGCQVFLSNRWQFDMAAAETWPCRMLLFIPLGEVAVFGPPVGRRDQSHREASLGKQRGRWFGNTLRNGAISKGWV